MALFIPPSQNFLGNDGLWSTFSVMIGSRNQTVNLLPASSFSAIVVVSDQACTSQSSPLSNCANLRGGTFSTSKGSWSPLYNPATSGGLYIPFDTEQDIETPYVPAQPGNDSVVLNWIGSNVPSDLTSQVVAAYEDTWPWLGLLGLRFESINLNNASSSILSPLGSLTQGNYVDSPYWAYAAGAWYATPQDYGSLTFGGYDSKRFDNSTSLTVPLGDTSDDLSVTVQRILIDNNNVNGVTDNGVLSVIDSTVAAIWLPVAVCQSFESILGLTWNSTYQMYLINDSVHTALMTRNPQFTFVLGANLTSSYTTTIKLPYKAFDLSATFPYAGIKGNGSQRYFPLNRTTDTTGYLGRTFLQEAYVMADYQNKIMTVGQVQHPSSVNDRNIVVANAPPAKAAGLSGGAIAGIVIGAIAGFALIAGALFLLWRRLRQQAIQDSKSYSTRPPASVGGTTVIANSEMEEQERREDRINEYFKPGVIFPPPVEEHYAKPELDATEVATGFRTQAAPPVRHELDGGNVRPSNRSQVSWGSAISPLNQEERMRSIELHGHPSPEIGSAASSPPLHSRQLSSDTLNDIHEMQ